MASDMYRAKSFLVLTIKLGEITEEEFRENQAGTWEPGTLAARLNGCSALIVREIDPIYCTELREYSIECIQTPEHIITNIVVRFLEREYRRASDSCCCP